MKNILPDISIAEFAAGLRKFPTPAFDSTATILEYLTRNPVAADSLAPYLTWDVQHYTRNLIDRTDLYELLAICWEVGQHSSIHNHRDQHCWMAAPIGQLLVQNYRVKSANIDAGKCEIVPTDILEMNPRQPAAVDPNEPVHKVYNPRELSQRAVTLHIYSRPFDTCVVYSYEQGTCGEIKLHFHTRYGKPEAAAH